MTEELAQIYRVLGSIFDPCSLGTGSPLSLLEMGLVKAVELNDGVINIQLRLTQPGCHFAPLIQQEIEDRCASVLKDKTLAVSVDDGREWSEEFITAEGRERLRKTIYARNLIIADSERK